MRRRRARTLRSSAPEGTRKFWVNRVQQPARNVKKAGRELAVKLLILVAERDEYSAELIE
jgi:hypothetical protein